MNLDDAIDDYNSAFGTELGVFAFAGDEDEFIGLVQQSIDDGKRLDRNTIREFFKKPKKDQAF